MDDDLARVRENRCNDQSAWLIRFGSVQARNYGITGDDAEDFVSQFIVKVLQSPLYFQTKQPCDLPKQWLWCVAKSCAKDCWRSRIRRESRETSLANPTVDSAQVHTQNASDTRLYLSELAQIITNALQELRTEPRRVFVLRYEEELSIADIAQLVGRTPHSIEQSLSQSRLRLSAILSRHGFSEIELRSYLTPPPPIRLDIIYSSINKRLKMNPEVLASSAVLVVRVRRFQASTTFRLRGAQR